MDFKVVIEKLLKSFQEQNIRYALIGGMALGAWGIPRGTVDIDFLVNREDSDKIDSIMKALDYECKFRTENVSQYVSFLRVFGEVDFLHAFRKHSLSILERAEERMMFGGTVSMKVVRIEDLIGLKVQGMINDESRRSLELSDIEALLKAHNKDVDWGLIREYFDLFSCNDIFQQLKGKYGDD